MSSADRVAALHVSKYRSKKELEDGTVIYEYGPRQVQKRNEEKADRIEKLRKIRSELVKQVKKDFKAKDLKTRLTALAVALIDHTYERVGNDDSAKEGHFGVTGWQKKHITFYKDKAKVRYVGKSGVKQEKLIKDKSALALLKEITKGKKPKDCIFELEEGGETIRITSKEVNAYLPEGITAKDLRGLHANEEMRQALLDIRKKGPELPHGRKEKDKILKKEFQKALEVASDLVGHEDSTLRSQYLVPSLEEQYLKDGTVIDRLNEKTAAVSPLVDTGEKTWSDGTIYWMDLSKDQFVHFTPLSRAEQILKSKKLLINPPYKKSGIDSVAAISAVWGWHVPRVQTTHTKLDPGDSLVAIVFKTSAVPKIGYPEEVLWDQDVPLLQPKIVSAQQAISKLKKTPHRIQEDDQVLYSSRPKTATKSEAEKEDEGAEKMLRPEPKKKPPRYDLRNNLTYDKDLDHSKDVKDPTTERDVSRNYKKIGGRDTIDKAWVTKVRKTWKDLLKKAEMASDLSSIQGALEKTLQWVLAMSHDIAFSKGFFVFLRGKEEQTDSYQWRFKAMGSLKNASVFVQAGLKAIAFWDAVVTPGTPEYKMGAQHRLSLIQYAARKKGLDVPNTVEAADLLLESSPLLLESMLAEQVRSERDTALKKADSEFSRKLLGHLTKLMTTYNSDIEWGTTEREFSVGNAKIVMVDLPSPFPQDGSQSHLPADVVNYVRQMTKAEALLKQKGLGYLWYGTFYVSCKDCGGENTLGKKFGVGAHYFPATDEVKIYMDPVSNLYRLVAHELGHRYWYKFMSSADRQRFSHYFGDIPAVSEYGGTNAEEDWAEVFSYYIDNKEMSREQLERFKRFLRTKKAMAAKLAAQKAKSEEAAKKLHEEYLEENPGSKKKWQDFFEKPDDSNGSNEEPLGEEPQGEEEAPKSRSKKPNKKPTKKKPDPEEAPSEEEQHEAALKQTISKVKQDLLKAFPGAKLPSAVRQGMADALQDMSLDQIQEFSKGFDRALSSLQKTPLDGDKALSDAESVLEDLSSVEFSDLLDPKELAENLANYTHARHVVDSEKARLKGKAKAVSETLSKLEKELAGALGSETYALPKEIKNELKSQLELLKPEAYDDLVSNIVSDYKDITEEYEQDSEEAFEKAKATLGEFKEVLDGNLSKDVLSGQIAHALHSQRVLTRHETRKEESSKEDKKILKSLAKVFKQEELPEDVVERLEPVLQSLDMDQKSEFMTGVQEAFVELQEKITKNEDGSVYYSPDLIREVSEALEKDSFASNPSEAARDAVFAMAAGSMIADPFNLAGKEVDSAAKTVGELVSRGVQSFEKYKVLPQEMRVAAAEQLVERLGEVDPEGPEAAELNHILDGIALAAAVDKRKDGKVPQVPGREMTPGFAELARALSKNGDVGLLLGSVDDFVSGKGQLAVQRAMDSMDDASLAEATQETMPEVAELLTDADKKLDLDKRAVLRKALIETSIDSMGLVDQLVKSRMKSSGDDQWDDADYRYEVAKKTRKSKRVKEAISSFLDWLTSGGSSGTALLPQNKLATNEEEALPSKLRRDLLEAVDLATRKQFGESEGHYEMALSRYLETGDPRYLRADPASEEEERGFTDKKSSIQPRFSFDTWDVITAGAPSVRVLTSFFHPQRGTTMSQKKTAAAKKVTDHLDKVANLITNIASDFGIPEKIAFDFAKRCDMISDHIDRVASEEEEADEEELEETEEVEASKKAYTQGTGVGPAPGSDHNMNLDRPAQRFNPAQIGKQVAGPLQMDSDESYMKGNFLQKEFNELSNFQEMGLFSNAKTAKAARLAFERFKAQLVGLSDVITEE